MYVLIWNTVFNLDTTHGKGCRNFKRVQKAATNLVPPLMKYSYEKRLKRLGIPSLDRKKSRGDMIETYKILTGKENIESEHFLKISQH